MIIQIYQCLEEMNVEVMLESLMIVFNSNEDIFFDFFC